MGVMIGAKALYQLISPVTTKVYPLMAPEGVSMPYVTYNLVSEVLEDTKNTTALVDMDRYQVTIFARTYDEIYTLYVAIRAALDLKTATVDGKEIKLRFAGSEKEMIMDNADEPIMYKPIEFSVCVIN